MEQKKKIKLFGGWDLMVEGIEAKQHIIVK